MSASPALNPDLAARIPALKAQLAAARRVQVRDLLAPVYAERLAEAALSAPYVETVLDQQDTAPSPEAMARLTPEQRAKVEAALAAIRARPFRYYAFDNLPIEAQAQRGEGEAVWRELVAFLNGPEMLGLVRDLTGETGIDYADAQLTRFGPGHFLTTHDDAAEGKKRFVAYVLNLTRTWSIDWGGLLAFHGADGNVAEAWTPSFNVLNLLLVPQPHSVTLVSPQAQAARLSVTGWYRGR